ncbi:hypothetical protein H4J58_16775 [Colwellia sp. MB3u-70]|uniref:hypothetical protein n=1 Tax=unclassified Colwellia TaxID=196834 RepID=UPI0015F586A9|nr:MULTISPECIES: hypothetical protein [unclassified Colwellia]MBA6292759.1 hypothetical protein [Colwellia sp. MB3u-8]MBA6308769.1 hypothetical protein [Colwellia sp. MB3u-70]
MTTEFNIYHGSSDFDSDLKNYEDSHFTKFPEMMPWIGGEYNEQEIKILVVGESYFFKEATFHHNTSNWYSKTFKDNLSDKIGDLSKRSGHRVRHHITRSIDNSFKKNKKKTHPMHRNLHDVLLKTEIFKPRNSKNSTPFDFIAYINYFQRPAESAGASISENKIDLQVALETIKNIISIIKPNIVMFASVKAYKAARTDKLLSFLDNYGVLYDYSAHPCSQHWNRACKKYGNIRGNSNGPLRGKKRFIKAIDVMTLL